MIQEMFSNIMKHASASHVYLSLREEKERLQVYLSDDGIGFNQKKVQKGSAGLGMKNIMARVNVLKGSIYLTTGEGKGTAYLVDLPL